MNDENVAKVKYALRRHAQTCREKYNQGWRLIHNPGIVLEHLKTFYKIEHQFRTNRSRS